MTKIPKFWLAAFPTFRYVEDVKAVATANGLTIVDESQAGDVHREHATKEPPKLTLRDEYKPAKGKGAANG